LLRKCNINLLDSKSPKQIGNPVRRTSLNQTKGITLKRLASETYPKRNSIVFETNNDDKIEPTTNPTALDEGYVANLTENKTEGLEKDNPQTKNEEDDVDEVDETEWKPNQGENEEWDENKNFERGQTNKNFDNKSFGRKATIMKQDDDGNVEKIFNIKYNVFFSPRTYKE
jgi:hypothetical protein